MTAGIAPQPNSWLCGPVALKHAMLAFGIFENEWTIARAAGANAHGADERDLARAARQFDCRLGMIRKLEPTGARAELAYQLDLGNPSLLCIDQWEHWVVAMGHEQGRFVVFDSRESPVIRVLTWEELAPRWRYGKQDPGIFDLHPVEPRTRTWSARFTGARVQWLQQPRQSGLVRQWIDVARLLTSRGRPPAADGSSDLFARPLTTLLAAQQDALRESVGGGQRFSLQLERLRFVAETYGVEVSVENEQRCLGAIEAFLKDRLQRRKAASEVA